MLKMTLAIKLYQDNQVTLMRAAEIAELNFFEFQDVLKERGIAIKIVGATKEEIDEGLAFIFDEV
ncbi:MAG: UPF0175 family protein [Chloroflexota bacterium]